MKRYTMKFREKPINAIMDGMKGYIRKWRSLKHRLTGHFNIEDWRKKLELAQRENIRKFCYFENCIVYVGILHLT